MSIAAIDEPHLALRTIERKSHVAAQDILSTTDPNVVHATAEKVFFIDMLTKDIELLPAIADLVDNSVDGARSSGDQDLSRFWIRVTATKDEFCIADNAGGIPIDIARNYAFRFGRPTAFKGIKGSVGQFGIGMKRAIFKLGSAFSVSSSWASPQPEGGSAFTVEEDVKAWAERPNDWTFRFSDLQEGVEVDIADAGTTIAVTSLHGSVQDDLEDPSIIRQLQLELSTRHQRSILQGLRIEVNDEVLTANQPALQYSDAFRPLNRSLEVVVEGDHPGLVKVQIVAGTVPSANKELDEGNAMSFQSSGEAGWYVFCNDRLLLAGDRTSVTGWGSSAAAYHPQYRNFRGYVYMNADDAGLLPWNTTKTAVDRDHQVFRTVASEMKRALVEVQGVINRIKIENARWTEQKQDQEAKGEAEPEKTALLAAVDDAPAVHVSELPEIDAAFAPASTTFPPKLPPSPTTQRIQYEVQVERYRKLAEVFGASSGSDLGRQTFEYVWKAEVE